MSLEMLTRGRSLVKMTAAERAFSAFGSLRWVPPLLWMLGIAALSQQSSPLGVQPDAAQAAAAHVALYGGLAFLLYWALSHRSPAAAWPALLVGFGLAVLFGVSDELHQAFVKGRVASEADVALDALGAAAGVAASWLLRTALRRLS